MPSFMSVDAVLIEGFWSKLLAKPGVTQTRVAVRLGVDKSAVCRARKGIMATPYCWVIACAAIWGDDLLADGLASLDLRAEPVGEVTTEAHRAVNAMRKGQTSLLQVLAEVQDPDSAGGSAIVGEELDILERELEEQIRSSQQALSVVRRAKASNLGIGAVAS